VFRNKKVKEKKERVILAVLSLMVYSKNCAALMPSHSLQVWASWYETLNILL
jgi:hypothetical protein